ncbi:MAG: heparinase II/III family protein [Clostridia bacterium]|nr:heparinase II/III family protein [Clostridia bacterium]
MNLLGRAMEKDFWTEVREKECFKEYREKLLLDWDMLMEEGDLRALRYSDWKMFFTTGNRTVYERAYSRHRIAMTASALLALIYPEEDKYINYLMDAIYTLCDEYTWCLPAHQPNGNENNNSHIDLCASGMAFYLAEIYTLLEDRLDPLIKSRIRAELDRRVFTPFLTEVPYSWWETGESNWTSVCTGSVASAFMLMKPDVARELLPRFLKSMEGYIRGFSEEGVCLEGADYWNYGFGNFLPYADLVKTFTNGEVDYFKDPKIKKIATFFQKVFLSERVTLSFADGAERSSRVIGRLHYIKAQYPDEAKSTGRKFSSFSRTYEFPTRLREALWFFEEDGEDGDDNYDLEFFAPSAEWFIKHTPKYGFAAKGGDNAEFHNHNDIGHFIYATDGKQIFCDLGAGVYEKKYFGPHRYECLEPNARCHSVPIIDGTLQQPGKQFKSRDFKFENGVLTLDISRAYGIFDEDERIDRRFDFSEGGVKLTDRFTFNKDREIAERVVTRIEPDNSITGKLMLGRVPVRYDATRWECVIAGSEPSARDRLLCYFIDFKPIGKQADFELIIDNYC